ncbi:hypothetical protein AK812_SmicGene14116 [Symbiodinium microadriaticum]|uniref:Uncharacterized protein n=1 Tax=Symbiodinium microadriaticum TaxID=2951 RepID=A0A1Q9E6F2_SYMMI|nr:hypothetical protein AK812_SmicGene14116 [Symbiodinium microadriaticum]
MKDWQAKLSQAAAATQRADRARSELTRMREAYLREVAGLRQQLVRKEQAEADLECWHLLQCDSRAYKASSFLPSLQCPVPQPTQPLAMQERGAEFVPDIISHFSVNESLSQEVEDRLEEQRKRMEEQHQSELERLMKENLELLHKFKNKAMQEKHENKATETVSVQHASIEVQTSDDAHGASIAANMPSEDADIEVDELDCLDLDVLVTTVEIPEARRPLVQGDGQAHIARKIADGLEGVLRLRRYLIRRPSDVRSHRWQATTEALDARLPRPLGEKLLQHEGSTWVFAKLFFNRLYLFTVIDGSQPESPRTVNVVNTSECAIQTALVAWMKDAVVLQAVEDGRSGKPESPVYSDLSIFRFLTKSAKSARRLEINMYEKPCWTVSNNSGFCFKILGWIGIWPSPPLNAELYFVWKEPRSTVYTLVACNQSAIDTTAAQVSSMSTQVDPIMLGLVDVQDLMFTQIYN